MTWLKVDDRMPEHPKVIGLTDRAFRAHFEALCYCAGVLTDGRIPLPVAKARRWARSATELVLAGLWEPDGDAWRIHDYLEHQRSKQDADELSAKRAEAGAKGGKARANAKQIATPLLKQRREEEIREEDPLSVTPLPPMTIEQSTRLRTLHRRISDEVFGGTSIPVNGWCEDLVRRGMSDGDVDAVVGAMRPSMESVPKGYPYGRAVLERRVEERERGDDPDKRAAGGAGAASGQSHAGQAGARGMARGGQGRAASAPASEYAGKW